MAAKLQIVRNYIGSCRTRYLRRRLRSAAALTSSASTTEEHTSPHATRERPPVPTGPGAQPTSRECAEAVGSFESKNSKSREVWTWCQADREACHKSVVETSAPSRKPALKEV